MHITTILVNDVPKVVVRPNDRKALVRFLRNAHNYLSEGHDDAVISHRDADERESERWHSAHRLHLVWGGDDESFFGTPL